MPEKYEILKIKSENGDEILCLSGSMSFCYDIGEIIVSMQINKSIGDDLELKNQKFTICFDTINKAHFHDFYNCIIRNISDTLLVFAFSGDKYR